MQRTSAPSSQLQLVARPEAAEQPEKEVQKAVPRRVVDPGNGFLSLIQARFTTRGARDAPAMAPTMAGALELLPPAGMVHLPASSLPTKFVHMATSKVRCSIQAMLWTPDGRRLISGAATGELTLWGGAQFVFESNLQVHEAGVRCMVFTHNASLILSCDDAGTLKALKNNLLPVKSVPAHKERCNSVSASPTDLKFATASDDATLRVWDLFHFQPEATLTGHGGDVKCCEWHPTRGLLASCSKDALVKLWDPRNGACLHTLHGHKSTVTQVLWNGNGNWLLSACRDQSLKLFDVRTLRELATYGGHSAPVLAAAWHPLQEDAFVSGGIDGTLCCWLAGSREPFARIEGAHESSLLTLRFHPAGHVLATGSSDASVKFWCRPRPGDPWRDRGVGDPREAVGAYTEAAEHAGGGGAPVLTRPALLAGALPPGLEGAKLPGLGRAGSGGGPPPLSSVGAAAGGGGARPRASASGTGSSGGGGGAGPPRVGHKRPADSHAASQGFPSGLQPAGGGGGRDAREGRPHRGPPPPTHHHRDPRSGGGGGGGAQAYASQRTPPHHGGGGGWDGHAPPPSGGGGGGGGGWGHAPPQQQHSHGGYPSAGAQAGAPGGGWGGGGGAHAAHGHPHQHPHQQGSYQAAPAAGHPGDGYAAQQGWAGAQTGYAPQPQYHQQYHHQQQQQQYGYAPAPSGQPPAGGGGYPAYAGAPQMPGGYPAAAQGGGYGAAPPPAGQQQHGWGHAQPQQQQQPPPYG